LAYTKTKQLPSQSIRKIFNPNKLFQQIQKRSFPLWN